MYFLNFSDICQGPPWHQLALKLGCTGVILLTLTVIGLSISGKWFKIICFRIHILFLSQILEYQIIWPPPNLAKDRWKKNNYKTMFLTMLSPNLLCELQPFGFLFLIVLIIFMRYFRCVPELKLDHHSNKDMTITKIIWIFHYLQFLQYLLYSRLH